MADFIEVERLTKTFPVALGVVPWVRARGRVDRRTALDDVTFGVRRGELFGLLGTNGAGKSTILRVLAGLIVADSGSVRIGGTDATSAPLALRRIVRLCTTDERSFYYRLSARRNLEYFGALVGLAGHRLRERIAAVAAAVDLTDVLDLRFDAFSSGMKQRLGIARALLGDPEVLILDEPTRAVDPAHAARIRTFVRRELVERQGKTVLLATNILEEAWELCDRIAVLRRGRIAALGAPGELDAAAGTASSYEITVDRSDAALLSRIRGVPSLVDMRFADDGPVVRIAVTLRLDPHGLNDLLRAVSANGIRVADIRPRERRPADVFAELVSERSDVR